MKDKSQMSEDELFQSEFGDSKRYNDESPTPEEAGGTAVIVVEGVPQEEANPGNDANPAMAGDSPAEAAEAQREDGMQSAAAPAEGDAPMADDEPTDPKDAQRAKSWEGRLRKREAELAAKEAALAEREAALAQRGEPSAEPTMDAAGSQSADDAPSSPPEAGAISAEAAAEGESVAEESREAGADTDDTPEDVRAILDKYTQDFGPEFVADIMRLAEFKAQKLIDGFKKDAETTFKSVDEVLSALQAAYTENHYDSIESAVDDASEIPERPEFKAYLATMSPEEAARIEDILDGGTAPRIIRELKKFKEWESAQAPAATSDTPEGLEEAAPSGMAMSTTAAGGMDEDEAFARAFRAA